jgi:tripartite-type tricarboxylate transporter receptor subunit TctC
MRIVHTILIVVAALVCARANCAEPSYPSRPIQIVVTVPPGGAADFVARIIGAKLADAVGQDVVIVNRGGAGEQPQPLASPDRRRAATRSY